MAADKPVILLIHGAFYQPVHYQEVADKLREGGFTVEVPALPTTGTNPGLTYVDDVDVINEALHPFLDDGREVVIVAHSSGTLPASHCVEGESVAERAECGLKGGIRHYLNVCGLAYPRPGKNFLGNEYDSPLQDFHDVEVRSWDAALESDDKHAADDNHRTASYTCLIAPSLHFTTTSHKRKLTKYGPQ